MLNAHVLKTERIIIIKKLADTVFSLQLPQFVDSRVLCCSNHDIDKIKAPGFSLTSVHLESYQEECRECQMSQLAPLV